MEVGGATTRLFLALAAFSKRLPSMASLFLSSRDSFCVPSFDFPRVTCFFNEAWLLREPSTDEIESPEKDGRCWLVRGALDGVDRECLSLNFDCRGGVDVIDGLGNLDTEDFPIESSATSRAILSLA